MLIEMPSTVKFHISIRNVTEAVTSRTNRKIFAILRYRSKHDSVKSIPNTIRAYYFYAMWEKIFSYSNKIFSSENSDVSTIVNMVNGLRVPSNELSSKILQISIF